MSRDLADLMPGFRDQVKTMYEQCADQGVELRPFFTARPPWDQARLWRQSRTTSQVRAAVDMLREAGAPWLAHVLDGVGPQYGRRVTNALPGLSWHQWGAAVDSYWLVDHKAEWSTRKRIGGVNGYALMAEIARGLGLKPGADFGDAVHVQAIQAGSPMGAGHTWPQIEQAMIDRWATEAPPFAADDTAFGGLA